MASSLSLDERALILAPAQLAATTSKLLATAGINCLCAHDVAHLQARLMEGAGMAIIAEKTLNSEKNALLQGFINDQPSWSDLPIVLLTEPCSLLTDTSEHPLGNLTLLASPFEDGQLLQLARIALRNRRRQYLAREQLQGLQLQLDARSQAQRTQDLALYQARKMEAIGQLAGGVAHDFNNLLTSIGGSFELIDRRLKQGRSEGLDGVLRMGREAVTRAARLTHRLLAFSCRQSLNSQRIDLRPLLQVQRLQGALNDSVTLEVRLPSDLWAVEADGVQLQEALDNLLLNACEAMPSGGALCIEASNQQIDADPGRSDGLADGEYLRLSIIDDGQGMSQTTLEHAFEPFFSTKPVGQGIGLGLSMVYGFSKQSRGHVALHSHIGQGTRVDLYLPRHSGPGQTEPATDPLALHAGGHDVLVVEDDLHVRRLLCQTLQEEGFTCQSAGNADDALKVLRSAQNIDLLISDVGLPGMNGRQLAEIARTLRPGLAVLFITGYAETAMTREGFLAPGMQLICKPFELKALQQQVTQMLGKP
ncbi:response regulator [Pseudomonas sp. Teo4]|uniref:response regulator n=1 Tax=Pseudomonas sp. Teo4 TaxID=3064528 RepID=UPI002ABABEE9|nr:response regulator [Pseudomonas sp. Teo4]MDZ3991615.1 Sensor histidine kinase RcsC [Pseudomonas sp. Teo4]